MTKYKLIIAIIVGAFTILGCEKVLDVTPPSEFAPGNVLTNEAGLKAVLFSAYANQQNPTPSRWLINNSAVTTDEGFDSGGGENLTLVQLINFTWDASLGTFRDDYWSPSYRCIRDANIIIDNIENTNMSDEKKKLYAAEALFLRAYSYGELYKWFGPVPLRISSETPPQLARATDEEMKSQIESDLLTAAAGLPAPGTETAFGRATKASALGILAKFYLNSKQWQKASDACKKIIDMNYFNLFPDYANLFRVENEGNKEMIMVAPAKNQNGFGNWFSAGALPPGFKTSIQIPEFVWQNGMANFATQYRLRDETVALFDLTKDKRAVLVLRSYQNTAGQTVDLLTTKDNARSLKYWDNNTIGNHSGNDIPILRYADILLTKSEADNELNGPTQASLELMNLIRKRAGIDALTLTDLATKEAFRKTILDERGRELYSEAKRREDLLRHNVFISKAIERGITNASEKHKLFPIPQSEIDANPLCKQNEGY